ncbi:MAG: 3-dehydroquinate synthase [Acidimicrobiia bacterium]
MHPVTRTVTVEVDPAYDVVVGAGTLGEVGRILGGRRCVALTGQAAVLAHHGPAVRDALTVRGVRVVEAVMDDGEEAKTLASVEALCRTWVRAGLLRGDAVVALGGGVVGDTAGLAAALYHRGIPVVQCPTTLLGQVDAAIGGKTAVNLPEGKNLVGAFHQPVAVLADVTTLATLPEREYRAGLGEVAKYALMGGSEDATAIAVLLGERRAAIDAREPAVLVEIVARCAAIKAHVVSADPHERTGQRATLNYGHTLAHALETVGHHDLLHGEAVAVGLVFAGALAGALERIAPGEVERHRTLVAGLGLPTEAPGLGAGALLAVMTRDKKAHGGLTFVLAGPSGLETVDDPSPAALAVAFRAVGIDS